MGFEYELVENLADYLDVKLELIIEKDINQMFERLRKGEGDIIAFNLTVTNGRRKEIDFTNYINTTKQVLIQRRPDEWRRMKMHQIEKHLIRNPIELENKTIYVISNSSYEHRLQNLSDEIGGEIDIVEADSNYSTEDLIRLVADKTIDYTISDENIAELNQATYSNIDIGTEVSLMQKTAWAVNKGSNKLQTQVNEWLSKFKKQPEFYYIYNKYFKNRSAYRTRLKSQFFSNSGGNISKYDDLLREYSKNLDWDWRILASQIYQESQFDPAAKSWAGAVGLMQLMPETAKFYGAKDPYNPLQSLKAGVDYLVWLDDFWESYVEEKEERIKFVLASYNIGYGHILDAMKLAIKYKADGTRWSGNVEKYLLLKSNEKYFNDEVVRNGYCRGVETVKYVNEIFERYNHYIKFVS